MPHRFLALMDNGAVPFIRGGFVAGMFLAVEHAFITQLFGALVAFATVFWTEWVRDHFRRKVDDEDAAPPKRKRSRKRKVKVAA